MERKLISMLVLVCLSALTSIGFAEHPRLFVTPERLEEIKQAITIPGTHHYEAYQALKQRTDEFDWRAFEENLDDDNWNYARSYAAQAASFMYLLTGDTTYSNFAYDVLVQVHADPDPDNRLPEDGYGLSRATVGRGFAMAYDWCYHAWSEEQKAYVLDKVILALDEWPKYTHANFEDTRGSNWVAVCRGGELVMMLAVDEEVNRARRFSNLKSWLREHMLNGYGDLGHSQEGLGYTGYGGIFLLPAIYACNSIDDSSLRDVAKMTAWWKLGMYSLSNQITESGYRLSVQNGVTNFSIGDEGWASLLLNSVPTDSLPYFQYFYDRHMGILSQGELLEKYDQKRGATLWSILYYPEDMIAQDPSTDFPKMVSDNYKGGYFFRNRWHDENDIIVTFMSDIDHHGHAWDQSEAGQLNLMAFNTRFMGGPGKEYGDPNVYSSLLIDELPMTTNSKGNFPNNITGELVKQEKQPRGGYIVVDQKGKFNGMNIEKANRHCLVDFDPNQNAAILSTLDELESTQDHKYTWQINLGTQNDYDNISVKTDTTGPVPTFTLYGRNEGYVKGWIMHPEGVDFGNPRIIDPFHVSCNGINEKLWIVMYCAQGDPVDAEITGSGLDAELTIDDFKVYYDLNSNEIKSLYTVPTNIQDACQDPQGFGLMQNYPNPFNGSTSIDFKIDKRQSVSVNIFDIQGCWVTTLLDKKLDAGYHHLNWDGKNQFDRGVASGIYLCRMSVNQSENQVKRLIYIK